MRLGDLGGRATLIAQDGTRAVDIANANGGRLGPGRGEVYAVWDDVFAWAGVVDPFAGDVLKSRVEGIGELRQAIVAP